MDCCTTNKCCLFFDLRKGTFIIAVACLVFESLSIIVNSLLASFISLERSNTGYDYAQEFMLFLLMLIICYKLLLCFALLVGWFKRMPDHIELWYKGYLLCVLLEIIMTIILSMKKFDGRNVWCWLITIEKATVTIMSLYFVVVVRSYFLKMSKESNYYQNIIYTQNGTKQVKPFKNHTYEELSHPPSTKEISKDKELEAAQYGFSKKGNGGEIYSFPQGNYAIGMPMPNTFENNQKQSSMLYPTLASP